MHHGRSGPVGREVSDGESDEMGRGGVSVVVAAAFSNYQSNYALGPILLASLHSLNTFYPLHHPRFECCHSLYSFYVVSSLHQSKSLSFK